MEQTKVKTVQKAYGVYSGNYDGGGVSDPLYLNIDVARAECLRLVKKADEESKIQLKENLKTCNTDNLVRYFNDQFKPMVEDNRNQWRNTNDIIRVIEYTIV